MRFSVMATASCVLKLLLERPARTPIPDNFYRGPAVMWKQKYPTPPIPTPTARRRGFKLQPRREWLSPAGTGYVGGACPKSFRRHSGMEQGRHKGTCAAVAGVSRLIRTLLQPRGLAAWSVVSGGVLPCRGVELHQAERPSTRSYFFGVFTPWTRLDIPYLLWPLRMGS